MPSRNNSFAIDKPIRQDGRKKNRKGGVGAIVPISNPDSADAQSAEFSNFNNFPNNFDGSQGPPP